MPGKAIFNINYKDNKAQADKVLSTYRTFTGEGNLQMDSIVIRVSTSLEGAYDDNATLSQKRADALKEYFAKTMGSGNGDMATIIKTRYSGEDWNTLARLVMKRTDMPNKSEIVNMLTQAVNPDQCEQDIKKTYPADYKTIVDSIYPLLNKADIVFNMVRPGMGEEITVNKEVRPGYAKALEYLQDREYWKALDILQNYPDYNTALCLVSMGYNAKALDLLNNLPQTGNTEYLKAILSIRANNDSEAIDHLVKACELDPTKVYRTQLDPEIATLVRKYNLQDRLNSAANSAATTSQPAAN
jgi:tetratricopeptide (TPR) repeat protein